MNEFLYKKENDEEVLLTRAEAAEFLGIKEGTLAVWATHKEHLNIVKIGRLVRYRKSDLIEFINRRTVTIPESTI